MKKINGYAVIAHKPYAQNPEDGFVILGAKESRYSPSGYEYVTAVVDSLDAKDWSWGNYINELDRAILNYNQR
jgi:hypothetical protein